jgi:hypothetical protein
MFEGHFFPKHRLHFRMEQLLPSASPAVNPVIRSMAGFQEDIRPFSSIVKTPSAMASIIWFRNRLFHKEWVFSLIPTPF